jgi:hypothetical protein
MLPKNVRCAVCGETLLQGGRGSTIYPCGLCMKKKERVLILKMEEEIRKLRSEIDNS